VALLEIFAKTDLGPPATALINRVFDAFAAAANPVLKVAGARAEVDTEKTRVLGRIENADAEQQALSSYSRKWRKELERTASVLGQTVSMLEDGADPDAIDEDWLLLHLDKIRLVSDKEMQLLWAKILAQEANKPGSFSKRCLTFLSALEKDEARLFTTLCGFILEVQDEPILTVLDWDDTIYVDAGITINSLAHLSAIGLVQFSPATWNSGFSRKYSVRLVTVRYFGEQKYFGAGGSPGPTGEYSIEFGGVELTELGRQLHRISGASLVPGFFDYVESKWTVFSLRVLLP
jgi:hypothetical protein